MKASCWVVLLCAAGVSACSDGQIGSACGAPPAAPVPGNSLRVLAFNTYLYPPAFNFGEVELTNDSVDERAMAIAAALANGAFDVLALSEAWSEEDAKDRLHVLCEAKRSTRSS